MVKKDTCIFCDIINGKAKSYKISENKLSIAILDINPLSRGHCLVIPKRHVPWWHDLNEEENQSLFSLAHAVAGKINKAYKPDFVAMYVRGRRIPHTHIFLVPTFKGDPVDRFFNTLEGFQESADVLVSLKNERSMKETCKKIRDKK